MVEKNAGHSKEIITFTIVHRDPVTIDFGHTIRAAWVKGGGFGLGHFLDFAKHLAATSLIKFGIRFGHPHRIEHPRDTEGGRFTGITGLIPTGFHKALRSKIINFVRLGFLDGLEE